MVITNPGGYEYIIEEMWRIFGTSYMDWKLILEAKTHFYDMLSTVCNPIFDANIFPGHLSQEEVWRLEKRTNYLNQVRKDAQRIERNNNRNLRRALKKVTEDQQSFDIYA
jgi:hypothetical protein